MPTKPPGNLMQYVNPRNCGGVRRMPERGTGVISGIADLNGTPTKLRVTLFNADGSRLGFVRTNSDGVYSFIGLPDGEYQILVSDDRQSATRSRVGHTKLPYP